VSDGNTGGERSWIGPDLSGASSDSGPYHVFQTAEHVVFAKKMQPLLHRFFSSQDSG